jgi:hypothetical protein
MVVLEIGFVELQTDKRNTYRKKVAADKASGKVGSPPPGEEESYVEGEHEGEGPAREGRPVAKKLRMDESGTVGEAEQREEEVGDEDEGGEEPEDDEEDEGVDAEPEAEERQENEELLEEHDEHEAEDEALDNGDDSD